MVTGVDALTRLRKRYADFEHEGVGIRCVSDQPWVTAAEPVDLLLVLAADVSRSVDGPKFQLQREGYAAALSDPTRRMRNSRTDCSASGILLTRQDLLRHSPACRISIWRGVLDRHCLA